MPFPVVLRPEADPSQSLKAFVVEHRDALNDALSREGALLFRGWAVDTERDFGKVAEAFGEVRTDLACSAGPRVELCKGVYTANEAPPEEEIPMHHETAQCEHPPKYVLFHCRVAPSEGGSTPIVRSFELVNYMKNTFPEVYADLSTRGVRYVREFPCCTDATSALGKSWQDTFGASEPKDVEALLQKQNTTWEWLEKGRLRTVGPRTVPFRRSGNEEAFFTAAESVFRRPDVMSGRPLKSFVHGDGTPLSQECIAALRSVGDHAMRCSTKLEWERGDVAVLNNATVMHSRETFVPPRKIVVSLCSRLVHEVQGVECYGTS